MFKDFSALIISCYSSFIFEPFAIEEE